MKVLSKNHQNQTKPSILKQYLQISDLPSAGKYQLISDYFELIVNLETLIYSHKKSYPLRISIGGIFTILRPLSQPSKIVNAVMAT